MHGWVQLPCMESAFGAPVGTGCEGNSNCEGPKSVRDTKRCAGRQRRHHLRLWCVVWGMMPCAACEARGKSSKGA